MRHPPAGRGHVGSGRPRSSRSRSDQLGDAGAFLQVGIGAGAPSPRRPAPRCSKPEKITMIASRQHAAADPGQRLHAVHHRHREVQQHDVGLQALGHVDRLLAVGRRADDLEVVLGVEQQGQQLAQVGGVVDHEDAVAAWSRSVVTAPRAPPPRRGGSAPAGCGQSVGVRVLGRGALGHANAAALDRSARPPCPSPRAALRRRNQLSTPETSSAATISGKLAQTGEPARSRDRSPAAASRAGVVGAGHARTARRRRLARYAVGCHTGRVRRARSGRAIRNDLGSSADNMRCQR